MTMKIRHSRHFHRKLAAELVQERFGSEIRNRTAKPVPVRELCRLVGVDDVTTMPMHVEGFLVNTPSGLAIRVNVDRSVTRQRFTVAHELGHILLSDYEDKPIGEKCRSQHFSGEEESLVDMIAAEILLPSEEISKLVCSFPSGWDVVEHMVWDYRVSYTAAIRRLLNLDGIMGVWITGNQTACRSLSAWCTDSVRRIVDADRIWKTFCWAPADGTSGDIHFLVPDSFGKVKPEQLRGVLKYMGRLGSRCKSQDSPKNCWILAWTEVKRPIVQLKLDFGFQF